VGALRADVAIGGAGGVDAVTTVKVLCYGGAFVGTVVAAYTLLLIKA